MTRGRASPAGAAAAAGLILLAAASALVKARSYDLWWHLKTGEWILSTWSVPRVDDFSFTSAGVPWIDHEWLFQILLVAFHRAGPAGLTLLKGACALAVAAIGYRALRRSGGGRGIALGVVAVSMAGLRFRLAERPESITLVLAAAFTALALDLAMRPSSPARRLTLLITLTVLWANLHAGALLAPGLAFACAAGSAARRLLGGERRRTAPAWAAVPLSALCVMVNPYGPRVFAVPSGIAGALVSPKVANPEWAPPSPADFPLFFVTLVVAAATAVVRLRQRRELALPRLAVLLVAAGLALGSVRSVGLFFALLPLVVDAGPAGRKRSIGRIAGPAGAGALLAATVWMLLVPPPGAEIGVGVQAGRFPEGGADFVAAHLPDARLYNDVASGGYLIWRGYPERRVFIDGRNEVHAALLAGLAAALDDGRRWNELLDRYGVEGAIVGYRPGTVNAVDSGTGRTWEGTFSELHFPRTRWALVYWDDVTMVFVTRDGRYGALAGSLEYRASRPEAWSLGLMDPIAGEAREAVVREISRRLAEDPGCRLAREAAAVYLEVDR